MLRGLWVQCLMLREGEIIFFRGKHTNWLSTTKWSALRTYTQVISYRLYLCVCVYIYRYVHVTTMNNDFGREAREGLWEGLDKGKDREEMM